MTFGNLNTEAILFRESQCKKGYILMLKRCFQRRLGWNEVKYARITITHICLITLTLASSVEQYMNIWPKGRMFKQLPGDLTHVNA